MRGADVDHWARSTLTRFAGIGVGTVFAHGSTLNSLRNNAFPGITMKVRDVHAVAQPLRGSSIPAPGTGAPAVLQGTAGSTGSPRTALLVAAAMRPDHDGYAALIGQPTPPNNSSPVTTSATTLIASSAT